MESGYRARTRIIELVICCAVVAPVVCYADECFVSYAVGKKFETTISTADLRKSPSWEADAENPPLSARKAIALADATAKRTGRAAANASARSQSRSHGLEVATMRA